MSVSGEVREFAQCRSSVEESHKQDSTWVENQKSKVRSVMKFIINSFLLGAGLAMDAVTVSMANGLAEKGMKEKKRWSIAGVYGFLLN